MFAACSSASIKLCTLDQKGQPVVQWQKSCEFGRGDTLDWLRNGKAFLTCHAGNVLCHVVGKQNQADEKTPTVLSLPGGPAIMRVCGEGSKQLVVAQLDVAGPIKIFDLGALLGGTKEARPLAILQDHDRPVTALAASSASGHVASANAAGSVYLHQVGSSSSTLGLLPGGPALVTPKRCLAFSYGSLHIRLAAGADDGQIIVWQVTQPTAGPIVLPTRLRGRVMGVGFGTYNKIPSAILLGCSESGQLFAGDMRRFPDVQMTLRSDLAVLQHENRGLREQVAALAQRLDDCVSFGALLGNGAM
ncbi:hypothetical protein TSOC_010860 [Tetrabaena socialis]|uniref:WD repeat domain-containing protein n=1 Tax=Tetrabaena socialis TaxID=47790 RepID=A0A2J7ZS60_9CHLO|nr:hypothetical protein TSOC_010860 [Tetrabaena socialis]|eukprot:PNH03105.1 hypothetical protein TSOC_010860 [Tetrabaena socialis]